MLLSLVPVSDEPVLPVLSLGLLIAVALLGALGITLAAAGSASSAVPTAPLVTGAALWATVGLAMLLAAASAAATAQTLDLANVVRAQINTSLYLFRQPVAASVFVMAFVLASDEGALTALLGGRSTERSLAEGALGAAVAAMGATLFLGGWAGPVLPGPVWVAVKSLALGIMLFGLRRKFAAVPVTVRLAMAWGAALAALLNLMVTMILVVM